MGFGAPVVFELWPVEIEKKVIFFAWDYSNLGDCLTTKEVGNLKRNVMANSR